MEKDFNREIEINIHKRSLLDLAMGYIGMFIGIAMMTTRKGIARAAYVCRPSAELMIMAAAIATQGGLMFLLMRYFQK